MKAFSVTLFTLLTIALSQVAFGLAPMPDPHQLADRFKRLADKVTLSTQFIQREDASEQNIVFRNHTTVVGQMKSTATATADFDQFSESIRGKCSIEGREVEVISREDKTVMRTATEPWHVLAGKDASSFQGMLTVLPYQGEVSTSTRQMPAWQLAGDDKVGGADALVLESVQGLSAPNFMAILRRGFEGCFSVVPAQKPKVVVLKYSLKHWIDKKSARYLRTVLDARVELRFGDDQDGLSVLIETKTTSHFRYANREIVVPYEALSPLNDAP